MRKIHVCILLYTRVVLLRVDCCFFYEWFSTGAGLEACACRVCVVPAPFRLFSRDDWGGGVIGAGARVSVIHPRPARRLAGVKCLVTKLRDTHPNYPLVHTTVVLLPPMEAAARVRVVSPPERIPARAL